MGSLKTLEIKTKQQSNFTWIKHPENVIKISFLSGCFWRQKSTVQSRTKF